IGFVIAFGPAIGPTLSGWLLVHFNWHALFLTMLPIVAITMLIAFLYLKNVTDLRKPKIDILSIIMSSVGFGAFLYGFSIASEIGWISAIVLGSIGVGILVIGLFLWRQLVLDVPMLEFRVFKFKMFTLAITITMMVLVSLIGAETLLLLFLHDALGFTPLRSGLMIFLGPDVIRITSS